MTEIPVLGRAGMRGTRTLRPHGPSASARVGMWHWCTYWFRWDRLEAVRGYEFVVRDAETGTVRKHRTPLDAAYFADEPFDVHAVYGNRAPFGRM